jgi:transposase
VREAAALLQPLSDALGGYVRAADKIHTDDTPVPVLEPGRGKTRTARLWTYVRDDRPAGSRAPPAVWYRYSPDRKGERAREHLAGYTGILQADAFSGYDALYRDGTVIEAGCWAHARRKFYDQYKLDSSPIAEEALRRIGVLYAVEREVRGQTPDVRLSARQLRSAPLLAELKAWFENTLSQVSAKSGLAKAIRYSLGHWHALIRYCEDGRVEVGRVEMWRGGGRFGLSVAAPFVWRCPNNLTIASFPHPALFQNIRPLRSNGWRQACGGVSVPMIR